MLTVDDEAQARTLCENDPVIAARLGFVHERDDVLYAVRTPIPPTG